jgi:hypothetical protein
MAPQDYTGAQSPHPPTSVRDDEKRPYQYEAVSGDDRLGKASAIDQVRIVSSLATFPGYNETGARGS